MMKSLALGSVGLVLLAPASSASATLIPLTQDYPDLNASTSITTAFTATNHTLSVSGFLTQFTEAGATAMQAGASHLAGGTGNYYRLSATLSGTGAFLSGTLSTYGVVVGVATPAQSLLTADLKGFGYSGTGSSTVFDFIGNVTGGALASYYTGHQIGILVNPGSDATFTGSFNGNFGASGGTTDTFNVPEPTTAALLGLAAVGLCLRRRRAASIRRG